MENFLVIVINKNARKKVDIVVFTKKTKAQ